MDQLSFSDAEHSSKSKQTRREKFLAEMEEAVPWGALVALIEPYYPKAGNGRRPYSLETMVRIHFMQQWFALGDLSMEEALYDSASMRRFSGLSLARDTFPDETTILNFRHLLEEHGLADQILATVNRLLDAKGLVLRHGTIVDATIINAPSSTKNKGRARDPEMHQTRKGKQWYFGMKAHIGVDADSGVVHTVVGTSGHVSDVTQAHGLLHGEEAFALGDAGYAGVKNRPENAHPDVEWHVAMRPGKRRMLGDDEVGRLQEQYEYTKAKHRAKVEHAFRILKRQFGYTKVRYRGLEKNTAQIKTLFALGNLWVMRHQLTGAVG